MKTNPKTSPLGVLLLTAGLAVAQNPPPPGPGGSQVHGDPFLPHGALTVTPTVVQPGVQPDMLWNIQYPRNVADLASLAPAGQLSLTDKADVKVRVAGVAFDSEGTDLPVSLWIRVGGSGSPWQMVFYGTETQVQPSQYVYDVKNVAIGSQIDLAARGQAPDGSWYATRWTVSNQETVAAATNGGTLVNECTAFSQGQLESFMTQFIDPNQNVVLGPLDVMHVFELGSTDPSSSQFDMQDLVVVTTLVGKNNNGHGNNLDGVDVSNPGNGGGGPNGQVDPSGTIDDERKVTRGKKK